MWRPPLPEISSGLYDRPFTPTNVPLNATESHGNTITAEIKQEDNSLQGIEHHMEVYGLHERLATLKGQMDIHHDLPARSYIMCRPNSCHHRCGGPEGPP